MPPTGVKEWEQMAHTFATFLISICLLDRLLCMVLAPPLIAVLTFSRLFCSISQLALLACLWLQALCGKYV